jgi:hypothetical protein
MTARWEAAEAVKEIFTPQQTQTPTRGRRRPPNRPVLEKAALVAYGGGGVAGAKLLAAWSFLPQGRPCRRPSGSA